MQCIRFSISQTTLSSAGREDIVSIWLYRAPMASEDFLYDILWVETFYERVW